MSGCHYEKNILQTSFNDDTKITPILSQMNIIDIETNKEIELSNGKTHSQYHECQEPGKVIYMNQDTKVDLEPKYIIKTPIDSNKDEKKYVCSLFKNHEGLLKDVNKHGIQDYKTNDVTDFEVLCANGKNPHKDP